MIKVNVSGFSLIKASQQVEGSGKNYIVSQDYNETGFETKQGAISWIIIEVNKMLQQVD